MVYKMQIYRRKIQDRNKWRYGVCFAVWKPCALDKGSLVYNECPNWGDCEHSSNTMSCASFNDMPKLSFNF